MELDKTVLFIDADISNSSGGRLLGIDDDHPGLIDILENEGLGIGDIMLNTNLPNLRIIPAGHVRACTVSSRNYLIDFLTVSLLSIHHRFYRLQRQVFWQA